MFRIGRMEGFQLALEVVVEVKAHNAILASFGRLFGLNSAITLAARVHLRHNHSMGPNFSAVELLSSARQAASMTSRARRLEPTS
jgi:hypothetical protein